MLVKILNRAQKGKKNIKFKHLTKEEYTSITEGNFLNSNIKENRFEWGDDSKYHHPCSKILNDMANGFEPDDDIVWIYDIKTQKIRGYDKNNEVQEYDNILNIHYLPFYGGNITRERLAYAFHQEYKKGCYEFYVFHGHDENTEIAIRRITGYNQFISGIDMYNRTYKLIKLDKNKYTDAAKEADGELVDAAWNRFKNKKVNIDHKLMYWSYAYDQSIDTLIENIKNEFIEIDKLYQLLKESIRLKNNVRIKPSYRGFYNVSKLKNFKNYFIKSNKISEYESLITNGNVYFELQMIEHAFHLKCLEIASDGDSDGTYCIVLNELTKLLLDTNDNVYNFDEYLLGFKEYCKNRRFDDSLNLMDKVHLYEYYLIKKLAQEGHYEVDLADIKKIDTINKFLVDVMHELKRDGSKLSWKNVRKGAKTFYLKELADKAHYDKFLSKGINHKVKAGSFEYHIDTNRFKFNVFDIVDYLEYQGFTVSSNGNNIIISWDKGSPGLAHVLYNETNENLVQRVGVEIEKCNNLLNNRDKGSYHIVTSYKKSTKEHVIKYLVDSGFYCDMIGQSTLVVSWLNPKKNTLAFLYKLESDNINKAE